MCGGYPTGVEYNDKAPWKQEPYSPKLIKVCVSVTHHKTFTVEIDHDDYTIDEIYNIIDEDVYKDLSHLEDNDWLEDEFEIIKED